MNTVKDVMTYRANNDRYKHYLVLLVYHHNDDEMWTYDDVFKQWSGYDMELADSNEFDDRLIEGIEIDIQHKEITVYLTDEDMAQYDRRVA
jgi:hypothetical protein